MGVETLSCFLDPPLQTVSRAGTGTALEKQFGKVLGKVAISIQKSKILHQMVVPCMSLSDRERGC